MVRYIDAEKAINSVDASVINSQYAISIIKSAPTEDAVPVVHARWKYGKCTKCGGDAPFWCMAGTYRASSYCPDCGAKMDEEVEE